MTSRAAKVPSPVRKRAAAKTLGQVTVSAGVRKRIAERKSLRLDIGCGNAKTAGCFGIDLRPLPGVDLVWDIEEFPWPLPDDCARVAFMSHVFEHLTPRKVLPFMAELHRVCQHGAQVLISGPHGVEFRYVQDPTHQRPVNSATFAYWDKAHPSRLWEVYMPPIFHLESFDVIPAGMSRDFNAILSVHKPGPGQTCAVCGEAGPKASRRGKAR